MYRDASNLILVGSKLDYVSISKIYESFKNRLNDPFFHRFFKYPYPHSFRFTHLSHQWLQGMIEFYFSSTHEDSFSPHEFREGLSLKRYPQGYAQYLQRCVTFGVDTIRCALQECETAFAWWDDSFLEEDHQSADYFDLLARVMVDKGWHTEWKPEHESIYHEGYWDGQNEEYPEGWPDEFLEKSAQILDVKKLNFAAFEELEKKLPILPDSKHLHHLLSWVNQIFDGNLWLVGVNTERLDFEAFQKETGIQLIEGRTPQRQLGEVPVIWRQGPYLIFSKSWPANHILSDAWSNSRREDTKYYEREDDWEIEAKYIWKPESLVGYAI